METKVSIADKLLFKMFVNNYSFVLYHILKSQVIILKSLKAEFTINRHNSHCAAACLSGSARLQSHTHTALTRCKNVTFTI